MEKNKEPKKINKSSHDRLEVFEQIEEHIDAIQHYDILQCYLRKISITLLMSTFAAIGFLLSIKSTALPFSSFTMCIFICLFSILMIFIISIMDLVFIDRLLMSAFYDALRVETENPWLFPIHLRMFNASQEHHGSLSKKVQFYEGYTKDLLFLLLVCVAFLMGYENWKWIIFLLVPIGMIILLFSGKLFNTIAKRSEQRLYKNFKNEWNI